MVTLTPSQGSPGHAPHVTPPQPVCRQIDWRPPTASEDRRRVLRWTCECRTEVYYLVSAGGHGYIERVANGVRVHTPG
jgi:hypothetical protein